MSCATLEYCTHCGTEISDPEHRDPDIDHLCQKCGQDAAEFLERDELARERRGQIAWETWRDERLGK